MKSLITRSWLRIAVSSLAAIAVIFIASFVMSSAFAGSVGAADTMTQGGTQDNLRVLDEATLVRLARNFVGIGPDSVPNQRDGVDIRIDDERTYFVGAGYWRRTAGRIDYRNGDPEHPIFIYTVRGTLGRPHASVGGVGSQPDSSAPESSLPEPVQPMTAVVVAIDAVTGRMVSFTNGRFLEDLSEERVTEADREHLLQSARDWEVRMQEANQAGTVPIPDPEATRELGHEEDVTPVPGFRQP